MKQTRQTYVKRELRRRRNERKQRIIQKVTDVVSAIALVVVSETVFFALMLM